MTNICQWIPSQPICRPADYCSLPNERTTTIYPQFIASFVIANMGLSGLVGLVYEINGLVRETTPTVSRNAIVGLAAISCSCIHFANELYSEVADKHDFSFLENLGAASAALYGFGMAITATVLAKEVISTVGKKYFPPNR